MAKVNGQSVESQNMTLVRYQHLVDNYRYDIRYWDQLVELKRQLFEQHFSDVTITLMEKFAVMRNTFCGKRKRSSVDGMEGSGTPFIAIKKARIGKSVLNHTKRKTWIFETPERIKRMIAAHMKTRIGDESEQIKPNPSVDRLLRAVIVNRKNMKRTQTALQRRQVAEEERRLKSLVALEKKKLAVERHKQLVAQKAKKFVKQTKLSNK